MKFAFIKTLLTLKFDNTQIKKYFVILNLCLFLSFFALTASGISVYIQFKINSLDSQNLELKTYRDIVKGIKTNYSQAINLIHKKMETFRFDKTFANTIGDSFTYEINPSASRERFFINVKNFLIFYDFYKDDLKNFGDIVNDFDNEVTSEFVNKKDIKELDELVKKNLKRLELISSKVSKDIQLEWYYPYEKKDLKIIDYKNEKIIFRYSDINYNEYQNTSQTVEAFIQDHTFIYLLGDKIIFDAINYIDQEIKNIKNEIVEQSNLEKKLILTAFIIQLIVFIFTQVFEVSTFRQEEDEKKNI